MLQITPNGPWGKDVHPRMPVMIDELISDLSACFDAGADGVHLHVRNQAGAETLDPAIVNETCRRVRGAAEDAGQVVEIGLIRQRDFVILRRGDAGRGTATA
jgi:uncharacterized protein (DUF849 family)